MNTLMFALALLGSDPFVRHTLPGGTELCVLELPKAPGASVFAILPHGLVDDEPGHAQGAHLVEHLLIRGVDPDGFEIDGMRINGETGGATLRLEVLAPAEKWREAVARPARWLATRTLDEAALAREKTNIAREEASTVAGGFTHKWALAAWSQIVAGGRKLARVHGDVADAKSDALAAYADRHAHLGAGARLVVTGPVKASEVLELVRKEYAALLADAPTPSTQAPVLPVLPVPAKAFDAEWDLAGEHALEWIELSGEEPGDRAAGLLLAQQATLLLYEVSRGVLNPGTALAEVLELPRVGRALVLSAGGFARADEERVQKVFATVRERLAKLDKEKSWGMALLQCSMQLAATPDFEAQRKQLAANPMANWIEGQYALNLATMELSTGLTIPELREALSKSAAQRAAELVRACIDPKRIGSLRLHPAR